MHERACVSNAKRKHTKSETQNMSMRAYTKSETQNANIQTQNAFCALRNAKRKYTKSETQNMSIPLDVDRKGVVTEDFLFQSADL